MNAIEQAQQKEGVYIERSLNYLDTNQMIHDDMKNLNWKS